MAATLESGSFNLPEQSASNLTNFRHEGAAGAIERSSQGHRVAWPHKFPRFELKFQNQHVESARSVIRWGWREGDETNQNTLRNFLVNFSKEKYAHFDTLARRTKREIPIESLGQITFFKAMENEVLYILHIVEINRCLKRCLIKQSSMFGQI